MSTGFVKIYASILDSTIWMETDETRILWITLLCMADPQGVVISSLPGLAKRANLSLEICIKGLEVLAAPDPHSQSQALGGARIVPVDGGWVIVNSAKYRAMQDNEKRLETFRLASKKYRESQNRQHPNVDGVLTVNRGVNIPSASVSVSEVPEVPEGESEGGKRIPTIQEWLDEAKAKHPDWPLEDIKQSFLYYDSIGWKRGKTPVTKWKLCIATCYHNWTKFHPAAQARPEFRREVPAG